MNQQMINGMIHIFDNFLVMNNLPTSFASDTELDEMLDNVLKQNQWVKLSNEEIEAVRKDLQYRYKVRINPGESIQKDYNERKWFTEAKEAGILDNSNWERYADYLVNKQNFSQNIVDTLGQITLDKQIMDCLADPHGDPCMKRGLIIGDVQSGKTSTYIGLICKAADAGYKVFIILTGTIESLRIQTQQRVEEGFIGIDPTNQVSTRVGVGTDNKPIIAESLTSRKADFTGNSDKTVVSVMNHAAVVFVIKKNTSVLTKLGDWLINMNADPYTNKIKAPMLLIDDEADNASINTKSNESLSRKLCKPPRRCRIETTPRREYTWQEGIGRRKRTHGGPRSGNCCRSATSAAWRTSRNSSRRPSRNSWRMAWTLNWTRNWATASTTTETRRRKTRATVIAPNS